MGSSTILHQLFNGRKKGLVNGVSEMLFICVGVLSAGLGLKGFLLPSSFIDGGVTGISLLIHEITGLPFSILLFGINFPFIIIAYKQEGKGFALRTFIAITLLTFAVAVIPYPVITEDKLLTAVFGGFFLGAGIGMAMRGGSVIDGTEVLALFTSRKSGLTVGDFIMAFNVVIFAVAAFVLDLEAALYSMLTYLSASKTVDFIVQGIDEYTGVTIVSSKSEELRKSIIEVMGRGVTIYKGKRGFGRHGDQDHDIDVIFTVITRLEVSKLKSEVEKIDNQAFVVMHSINETKGGMIKKLPLH